MAGFGSSHGRWMAVDVGSKTIGVAITDPLKITARPLTTLTRHSLDSDAREIMRLAREQEVEKLIVGKPRHLGGEASSTLDWIQPLVDRLEKISTLSIEWFDERLSTKEAEQLMAEAGLKLAQRRRRRNEYAAAVILRRYLEEER